MIFVNSSWSGTISWSQWDIGRNSRCLYTPLGKWELFFLTHMCDTRSRWVKHWYYMQWSNRFSPMINGTGSISSDSSVSLLHVLPGVCARHCLSNVLRGHDIYACIGINETIWIWWQPAAVINIYEMSSLAYMFPVDLLCYVSFVQKVQMDKLTRFDVNRKNISELNGHSWRAQSKKH